MKTDFYIFSGTGNTRRVCALIAEQLRKTGNDVTLRQINKDTLPEINADCVVIGYPVHAFNAPKTVLNFLKRLPDGQNKLIYFIQTSGEPLKFNNAAFIHTGRIAKRKGYRVMGGFSYVMPYNIIFHHSEGMAARMWNVVKLRAPLDASIIADKAYNLNKANLFERAVSFTLRIEHPAMPILGRHFKVTKDCVGCGLCERICPQKNIALRNGKPAFGTSCVGCMGCAFSCPENAIRISLLDGWRVNGAYRFDAQPASDGQICKYCRKSYLKYFHRYETIKNQNGAEKS